MKLLQHILYINLEHRPERKQHFLKQFQRINLVISHEKWGEPVVPERFNAIHHPTYGAIGCTSSHLACLKLAKERNLPYVCIMEDDILFTKPKVFLTQLRKFEQEFESKRWDVLMLGGNNKKPYQVLSDYCLRARDIQTGMCYIVNGHYYDKLIQNMEESLEFLEKFPIRRYSYSLDIYWKRLQRDDLWFLIIPLTITQNAGYSDIELKDVDYTKHLLSVEQVNRFQG